MSRPSQAVVCAAVVCMTLATGMASGAEKWTEVRTPSLRVVTNGSAGDAREVASNFERLGVVLTQISQISTRTDVPLTILAVKSGKQLRDITGLDRQNLAGLFAPGHDMNVVVIRLDLERESRYQVAYHEYVHLLVHQTIGRLPVWLNEGLADFYAESRLETDSVLVGMPASTSLALLQERSLLPIDTLVAVDQSSPHYTEDNRATVFYAQSWALTHFLMFGDEGAHRAKMFALLEASEKGATPAEAARQAFGDLAVFEKQFRAYISRYAFKAVKATVPKIGADMQTRVLSPAEALAVQASVHATVSEPSTAMTLADQAIAADATLPDAWMAKARSARRADDNPAVEAALAKAIELGSTDPLAHFGWAEARLRSVALSDPVDPIAKALERSLELKKDLARALSTLAYVRVRQDRMHPDAFELTVQAATLEPGNVRHFLTMATVLYARRDKQALEAALGRAALVAQGDEERARVEETRKRLVLK